MFTFTELPLASVVGLSAAFPVVDGFLPPRWAADAVGLGLPVSVPVVNAGGLRRELELLDDVEGLALLDSAWDEWLAHRSSVVSAVNAEAARVQWAARRKASGNSPQARKELRFWSQQAAQLAPPAIQVSDRVAVAVNGAAQGVTHIPLPEPMRRVLSWH